MKKLYFIIPVYKVEDYLERCINSVLEQSYNNIETILVDDGSPDNCPQICDGYAQKYSSIHVIHKENGGLSDARNAGLDYVYGKIENDDYIAFLDSDDFVHPDFAEKMIALCEDNDCGAAQCGYIKGSDNAFPESGEKADSFSQDAESALLGYTLKSQCWAKIFRADVFLDLRFTKDVINEDEFITYKAIFKAQRVVFTDEKLLYYYQRGTSIMGDVAKKMKDNPHKYDYLTAYRERIKFFAEKDIHQQVMKTHEKICTDVILRYCEQMYLNKKDRDTDCVNADYLRIYREHYKEMIKRKGMPFKRRLMFVTFNICPYSATVMGKIFTLRK